MRAKLALMSLVVFQFGWHGCSSEVPATQPTTMTVFGVRERELIVFSGQGKVREVKKLIDSGVNVNVRDPDRDDTTALMVTTFAGHTAVAKVLLDAGADVNLAVDGTTALHSAMLSSSTDIARMLVKKGADVNAVSEDMGHVTPLHLAALQNCPRCIFILSVANAELNRLDRRGQTPLHSAARCGNLAAVQALLLVKADKNIRDADGKLPIDLAEAGGYRKVAEELRAVPKDVEFKP